MSWFILPLLLSDLTKEQRKEVTRQLLPLSLPGAPETKLAIATITASRQVREQALADQKLVEEAVAAGGMKSAAELAQFPALNSAFKKLPVSVQGSLFPAVASPPRGEVEVPVARAPDAGTTGAPRTRSSSEPGTPPGPRA